jgi:hypothetical protein
LLSSPYMQIIEQPSMHVNSCDAASNMLPALGPCLGRALAWQGCCTATTRAGIGPPALLVARPAVHILEVTQAGLAGWMLINPGILCMTQSCLTYAMTWHHHLPHECPSKQLPRKACCSAVKGTAWLGCDMLHLQPVCAPMSMASTTGAPSAAATSCTYVSKLP